MSEKFYYSQNKHKKTRGAGIEVTQKLQEETWIAANNLCSLCKIHAELCSKIADVHGIEVHDVWIWKFVYFRNISDFYCITSET